jgi:hypothetical protein
MDDADLDQRLRAWRDDTLHTTAAGDQSLHRDLWLRTHRGAAVSVLAAVVAVTVGPGTMPSTSPFASPAGTRTVTYDGVSLDVPAMWSTNREWCGSPVEDTVLTDDGYVNQCLMAPRPVSSVEFRDFPAEDESERLTAVETGAWSTVDLDGHQVSRRDSVVRTEAPPGIAAADIVWPDIIFHRTELVVADHDVWITVQAVTPDVVTRIAETERVSF